MWPADHHILRTLRFVPDTIAPYFLFERTTTLGLNRIVTDPKLFPNLTLHAHDLFVMNILRVVLYKLFQKKALSLFNFFNRKKLILYDESTKSLTTGEKGGLEAIRGDEKSFQ